MFFQFIVFNVVQVNASPSMTADTPSDYNMKFGLLEDCFGVVDPEGKRAGNRPGEPQDLRVGGFDLVWADGKEVTQPSRYEVTHVPPAGVASCSRIVIA